MSSSRYNKTSVLLHLLLLQHNYKYIIQDVRVQGRTQRCHSRHPLLSLPTSPIQITMLWSVLLLIAAVAASWANPHPQPRPTAVIAEGVVVGTTTSLPAATATINKFLGMPFAQSPPERFALPQPPERFRGQWDASQFKDSCTQQFNCKF